MTEINPFSSLQLMIVDKDRYVRDALREFFDSCKLRFLLFKSGEEGLNALNYQKINIVFADYFLPDMDGLFFLKKVTEISPETVKILMTTVINDNLEKEAAKAGVFKIIEKPLSIMSIETVIQEISIVLETNHE